MIGILGTMAEIPNVSEQELDRVVDINLKGTFNSLRAQLPNVVDGASIVNIASMAGLTAVPFFSPYSLTKHAVNGLRQRPRRLPRGASGSTLSARKLA